MPKVLAIFAGVVVLILAGVGAIVALVSALTAAPTEAATRFVTDVAQKGPHEAYLEASPALRANQSEAVFDANIASLRLTQASGANWSNREMTGDTATISGTVHLRSGDTVPLMVDLVKQDKSWLVSAVRYGAPSPSSDD